jgi:hypothetical protein
MMIILLIIMNGGFRYRSTHPTLALRRFLVKKILSRCMAGILLSLAAGQVAADLDKGLVAYYPFDGNALDASGNDNHGTVYGATLTDDRTENSYRAYHFDGSRSKIVIQDAPLLNFGKTGFSIAVWIKTDQTGIWKRIITKRAATNAGNWYSLAVHNGKARFEIFAGEQAG